MRDLDFAGAHFALLGGRSAKRGSPAWTDSTVLSTQPPLSLCLLHSPFTDLSPCLPLRLPSPHRSRGNPDAHRVFGEGGGVRAGRAAVARSSQPMAKTRAPKTEPDREAARDDRYRGESAGGARLPRHQQTEKARTTRPASHFPNGQTAKPGVARMKRAGASPDGGEKV